jgi:hypothetical protein
MNIGKSTFSLLAVFLFLYTFAAAMELGNASMDKNTGTVNEEGDWTVHYETGPLGIAAGGGIRVQFPQAWFVHPWAKRKEVQTANPGLPHYVSAKCSRNDVSLELTLGREGVDGQHDRFWKIFDIMVREKDLLPGERISVTFANTPVPLVAESDFIQVGVDPSGNKRFFPLETFPEFTIKPGKADKILAILPSMGTAGTKIPLNVVALDPYNNKADSFRGTMELICRDLDMREICTFSEKEGGVYNFMMTFSKPGVFTVLVKTDDSLNNMGYESNPIHISKEEQEWKYFWGDLHGHNKISKDGIGCPETAFRNARDVFRLDFFSSINHCVGDKVTMEDYTEGIMPREWDLTLNLVRQFNKPQEFVTILGYEWSSPAPYGDNNIYYKTGVAPFFDLKHYTTIQELWARLERWDAFTVPHHTAIMWRGINSPYVDWSIQNERQRPAVEIYSFHGACEFFNNPMKYEDFDFTPTTSNFGPYYARDAWAAGNYLAALASSDNHTAQPGQPHGGLTCVLAPELTREAIYDAIAKRRAYATTGARILLDFKVNGRMMGERFALEKDEKPEVAVDIVGTAPLEYVEIMRFDGKEWKTAHRWEDPGTNNRSVKISWKDDEYYSEAIYYCRLKQKEKYFGRYVMAWSTPIWVGNKYEK